MVTIIKRKVNGYGPYAYRVEYVDGEHYWDYLGRVDELTADDLSIDKSSDETRDNQVDDSTTSVSDVAELGAGITDADPNDFEPGEYGSFLKPQPYKFDIPGRDDAVILNKLSREDKLILTPSGDIDLKRGRVTANRVVRIKPPEDGEYGAVTPIDSPFEAKDDIKALDWEDTHRSWNGSRKRWEVDADAVGTVAEHLAGEGWTVAMDVGAASPQLEPVVLKGDS